MKQIHRANSDVRTHYTVNKSGTLLLKTKLLYAGRLDRSQHWKEELHSHTFCEIIFVRSGNGELHLSNNQILHIKKGDIIIYNPKVEHSETTKGDTTMEFIFLGFTELKLANLPPDTIIAPDVCHIINVSDEFKNFEILFTALATEAESEKKYCDILANYLLKMILISILRIADSTDDFIKVNDTFSQIRKFIEQNYTQVSTMDEICDSLFITKYYLSHVFKEYTGMSPIKYITFKRMELAKTLLAETDTSVSKIAAQCGYTDLGIFFKSFKKIEEITPKAYREKFRQ